MRLRLKLDHILRRKVCHHWWLLLAMGLGLGVGSGFTHAQAVQTVQEQPDCVLFLNLTTQGSSGPTDNRTKGCRYWVVTYSAATGAGVQVTLEGATDNNNTPGAYSTAAFTVVSPAVNPATSSTDGVIEATGYAAWVRVRWSAGTAVLLRGTLYGWKNKPVAITSGGGGGGGGSSNVTIVGPLGQTTMAASIPVTIASNQSAIIVQGGAANGAAVAGNPNLIAGSDGTNTRTLSTDTTGNLGANIRWFNGTAYESAYDCPNTAAITFTAASGNVQIVPLSGTTVIRVCHVSIASGASTNFKFTYGTGSNCGTGTTDLTGLYQSTTAFVLGFGPEGAMRVPAGQALCLNSSAAITAGGTITYARY